MCTAVGCFVMLLQYGTFKGARYVRGIAFLTYRIWMAGLGKQISIEHHDCSVCVVCVFVPLIVGAYTFWYVDAPAGGSHRRR